MAGADVPGSGGGVGGGGGGGGGSGDGGAGGGSGAGTGAGAAADAAPAPAASVLDAWIAFGLNARRATLDQEGLLMARRQDESAQSRKELAVSTRNFKRNKPAADASPEHLAASKAFTALLKMYQAEVDSLTSRAKAAESAYLALYRALYEVPDPVPELRLATADRETILRLKEEMRALRLEHSGLAERSAAAREYEARIETLEAQNKSLSARVAEDVKTQVEEKQAQWMAAQRKAIEAYELREQELLHQLSVANAATRERQAAVDALKQQRDDVVAQVDNLKNARVAGAEMIAEDGARARDEVNDLRRRCMQLEAQVAALSAEDGDATGKPAGDSARSSSSLVGRSALSAELAAREVEISQLKDQVAALEGVLTGQDAAKSAEFARLTSSIAAKDDEISSLKKTLDGLPSESEYETMKRQFEALKSFQLNDDAPDGAEEMMSTASSSNGPDPMSGVASDDPSAPRGAMDLERRLLGKLKMMENKATAMRVELSGKDSRIEELSGMVRSLEERNDDQKALIAKLEEGINAMTGDPSSAKGLKARYTAEAGGSAASSSGMLPLAGLGVSDSNGSGLEGDASGWDWGEQQQAVGLQKIIQEEPTMLDIVAGQRDRFRARNLELETENRKAAERLERVTADVDRLKTDNVRLYEKIRYLQSYMQSSASRTGAGPSAVDPSVSGGSNRAGGSGLGRSSSSTSIPIGNDDEDGGGFLNQYRAMYEEMVNPYTLFNRRERHKRISEMSAPERLTLRATQRAVSTKASRIFVFTYALCLHVLVFAVLGFASTGGCSQDDITTKAQH